MSILVNNSIELLENVPSLFPVAEIKKVSEVPQFQGFTFNSWEQNVVMLNNKHIATFASKNYALIQNEDVILPIVDFLGTNFGEMNIRYEIQDCAYFVYIEYPKMAILLDNKKDGLYPIVQIKLSYNGQIKAQVKLLIGRLICTNGMMTIEKSAIVCDIKHTKKEKKQFLDIDTIIANTGNMLENFTGIVTHIPIMESVKLSKVNVNFDDAVKELISGTNFPIRKLDDAMNIARKEAQMLNTDMTLWLAYNGFNHVLNHDKTFKMNEKLRNELDAKLVNKIHSIALELS